jgi:hypothetical protein
VTTLSSVAPQVDALVDAIKDAFLLRVALNIDLYGFECPLVINFDQTSTHGSEIFGLNLFAFIRALVSVSCCDLLFLPIWRLVAFSDCFSLFFVFFLCLAHFLSHLFFVFRRDVIRTRQVYL